MPVAFGLFCMRGKRKACGLNSGLGLAYARLKPSDLAIFQLCIPPAPFISLFTMLLLAPSRPPISMARLPTQDWVCTDVRRQSSECHAWVSPEKNKCVCISAHAYGFCNLLHVREKEGTRSECRGVCGRGFT